MNIDLETLGTFITSYIKTHDISINKLAQETKISHGTIDRWIAGDYEKAPLLEHLKRLADYTATDLCYLVELVFPSGRDRSVAISYSSELMSKLPDDWQKIAESMLITLTQQYLQQSSKKK